MVAAEELAQVGNGSGSMQVAKDLAQVFAKVFHSILALLQAEAEQVRDGLLRIVDDGVQKAAIQSDEPLLGGAQQIVRGDLSVLAGAQNQTSSFHGLRYSR